MDVSVVWFRRDLRLHDNEAVAAAARTNAPCLYVFIVDPWFYKQLEIGWLRVKFLFECLAALDTALQRYGNRLCIVKGESVAALQQLLTALRSQRYRPHLYFNRDIQVLYGRTRDEAITRYCADNHIPLTVTSNYFLLDDESQMHTWWQRYYAYQHSQRLATPSMTSFNRHLDSVIAALPSIDPHHIAEALHVQVPSPRQALFIGGETEARKAVYSFLKDRVGGYRWKVSQPYLAQRGATSLLGPHLAFGTISNRTVFQAAFQHHEKLKAIKPKTAFDITTYLDRLRWRDSFTQRLWFHPELMWQNRFPEFDAIYNEAPLDAQHETYFERWKNGQTGFPLLDAAMTQLRLDGFINFRMRAMAATFLTINCGVSWHHGARHFMNCLVDGDIAINHWQWQMQAGVTNPLSPTFRMYNPTKNFQERDSAAAYVHFWLPATKGKSVNQIITAAEPMLDFTKTRTENGKIVSDIRKQVRQRIIAEKGLELAAAETAHRTVKGYYRRSSDRYARYIS